MHGIPVLNDADASFYWDFTWSNAVALLADCTLRIGEGAKEQTDCAKTVEPGAPLRTA
jgi:hypothetical protein